MARQVLFIGPLLKPGDLSGNMLQGDIARREDVGMACAKHQEYFGGPGTNPGQGNQELPRASAIGRCAQAFQDRSPQLVIAMASAVRVFCFAREQTGIDQCLFARIQKNLWLRTAPPHLAIRPKTAAAEAFETCCDTMISASPSKPGERLRSGTSIKPIDDR